MNHMFRKMRIAFSLMCGIVCLLLVGLWVRSYWWADGFDGSLVGWYIEGESEQGQMWAAAYPTGSAARWRFDALPTIPNNGNLELGAEYEYGSFGAVGFIPHWLAVTVTAALATLLGAGTQFRFGLRTLLIATTLVALLLAMVVYTAK
jgi:hypothetical protein